MPEFDERTERATPRRREKAREKGQVGRSRELSSMAATAGILLAFYFGGGVFFEGMTRISTRLLGMGYGSDPVTAMRLASMDVLLIVLPFMVVPVFVGLAVNVVQGGLIVKPLGVEMSRINPLSGLQRFFSVQLVTEFLKSVLKFIIGGVVIFFILREVVETAPFVGALDLSHIRQVSVAFIVKAVGYIFGVFFLIAIIDYAMQKWQFERSIRMTKEEVKQEYKETEGDPRIKSKVKSIQKELARRRMMQEVPRATVVITNPTHFAVALRYKAAESGAPRVVAKGKDLIAEKIRETARRHGVPIIEDKPLARALYEVDLGVQIPESLYKAVAKILAHIYRLQEQRVRM